MGVKPVPLNGSIVLKMIEEKKVTDGGIMLSEGAVPTPRRAVVVLVGPGKTTDYGVLITPPVVPGDVVYLKMYAGADVNVAGVTYTIVQPEDLLVKFEDDGEEEPVQADVPEEPAPEPSRILTL